MESIDELKSLKAWRSNDAGTGYLQNPVRINYDRLKYIAVAGPYDSLGLDRFMKRALRKFEKRIIAEALKLEQIEYDKTLAAAKIEMESLT